jgi:hypothetical protein
MTPQWKVNIATPTDRDELATLFAYVESPESDVLVSAAYHHVKSVYDQGGVLNRDGFNFYFWFYDERKAIAFAEAWHSVPEIVVPE